MRTFRSALTATLASTTLVLFAVDAAPEPPAAPSPLDGVYALAETMACRTIAGETWREDGSRDGGAVAVRIAITGVTGIRHSAADSYTPAASGGWHVVRSGDTPYTFDGTAGAWTGATWSATGRTHDGAAARTDFERLPNGDIRRTTFVARGTSQRMYVAAAERCTSGDVPPPADACITPNAPANTLWVAPPQIPPGNLHGEVRVVLSLDAGSHVVATRILSTSSVLLNPYAIDVVRRSLFRTEIRDCRPIAEDFFFEDDFD